MDQAQRSAIRKCRVRLVNDLMIEHMFDSVESKSLFTPIMLECIKAKESRPEKVRTFLDYLQCRGPDAFDLFLQCLRETENGFAASYVLEAYLDIKNNTPQNNFINRPGPVSMANNMYLGQETQRSHQGQMSSVKETQGSAQGQMSSVMETQGSNEAERKEEEMEVDKEDSFMDQSVPPQQNELSTPGSTSQGTCPVNAESKPSLPGQFAFNLITLGTTRYTGNFTEVNNEVSRNINHQGVQIPAPQVMLTKTWFLNPATRQ